MSVSRKGKVHRKANVLSVRLSDEELAAVIALMGTTRKRKSEILKDAFNLYLESNSTHN